MVAAPQGFIYNPVKNRTVAGLVGAKTIGLILHVQAGNGALGGWFNNPAASASSTWWAGKQGQREQYGNPDTDKFWAQSAGNSQYHSIETEGYPNEALTADQIESVAVALAWGHNRYGWPLVLAERPGQPGLGWHGMGGSAWGGHTGCPGDKRKAQRAQIVARAKELVTPPKEWFDMPIPDADLDKIANRVVDKLLAADRIPAPTPSRDNPTFGVGSALEWTLRRSSQTRTEVAAVKAALAALAKSLPDATATAVLAALDADYDAEVTLTPKEQA